MNTRGVLPRYADLASFLEENGIDIKNIYTDVNDVKLEGFFIILNVSDSSDNPSWTRAYFINKQDNLLANKKGFEQILRVLNRFITSKPIRNLTKIFPYIPSDY